MTAKPLLYSVANLSDTLYLEFSGLVPLDLRPTIDHFVRLARQSGQIIWRTTEGTVGATLGADKSGASYPSPWYETQVGGCQGAQKPS